MKNLLFVFAILFSSTFGAYAFDYSVLLKKRGNGLARTLKARAYPGTEMKVACTYNPDNNILSLTLSEGIGETQVSLSTEDGTIVFQTVLMVEDDANFNIYLGEIEAGEYDLVIECCKGTFEGVIEKN